MTENIEKALKDSKFDVDILITELKNIFAVDYKEIPLFDNNMFTTEETIESLWKKLSSYWDIFDYDLLLHVINICDCEEATSIFKDFSRRIYPSKLQDVDLVLYYEIHKKNNFNEDTLRVKLNAQTLKSQLKDEVKKTLCEVYKIKINKYVLHLKTIRTGCIEMMLQTSTSLRSHIRTYKIYRRDAAKFAELNILSIGITDMELKIPPNIQDTVGRFFLYKFIINFI